MVWYGMGARLALCMYDSEGGKLLVYVRWCRCVPMCVYVCVRSDLLRVSVVDKLLPFLTTPLPRPTPTRIL